MKKAWKYILGFESYRERICKLRIKGKHNNITLIHVYACKENKTDEDKEQIYEDSKSVVDRVPKCDIVIIFGDPNAKLGKEGIYSNVTGKHTLHEGTNRNVEMKCEFVFANNKMSTQFQHKQMHKATWIPPSQNTINQIDHVFVNTN